MKLISKKNFLIILAAALVVAFGIMALSLANRSKKAFSYETEIKSIQKQSDSDSVEAIEKDLDKTDLSDIDKELQDIDKELNQPY